MTVHCAVSKIDPAAKRLNLSHAAAVHRRIDFNPSEKRRDVSWGCEEHEPAVTFLVRDQEQVVQEVPVHIPDLSALWGQTLYPGACPR